MHSPLVCLVAGSKSVTRRAFILAALTHLKLTRPLPKKKRLHELLDPKSFLDQMEKLTTYAGNVKIGVRNVEKTTRKSPSKKAAAKKHTTARNPLVPSREAVAYTNGLSIRLKCDDCTDDERICWSYWGESLRECLLSRSLQSYQIIALLDGAILINRVGPEF